MLCRALRQHAAKAITSSELRVMEAATLTISSAHLAQRDVLKDSIDKEIAVEVHAKITCVLVSDAHRCSLPTEHLVMEQDYDLLSPALHVHVPTANTLAARLAMALVIPMISFAQTAKLSVL
jgi:hypothetical protein